MAGSPGPGRAVWSTGRPLSLSLTNAGTERLLTNKCWPRTGPENESDGPSEEIGRACDLGKEACDTAARRWTLRKRIRGRRAQQTAP